MQDFLKKENLDKGIKIKVEDDKVDITLFVIMEYGVNIVSEQSVT